MSKSRIFLFLCLAFIGGVFVESLFNLQPVVWLGILILGVMLAAIFWARTGRQKIAVIAGCCLVVAASGAWRFGSASGQDILIKQFNDKGPVSFSAKINDEPDIRADNIKYKVETRYGQVLVVAEKYPAYQYGDILEISGKLKTPKSDEDFDYAKYLAKDDIYSIVYYPEIKVLKTGQGKVVQKGLFWLKNKFESSINQILSEPQASLLAGLLLGEKRGFPQSLIDDFSRTGTTHIIALSGYNITIIAVALMGLFNFFMVRRRISFWLAVAMIILFVLMTGASASAVRAAVMGILVLLAQQSGRLYSIQNALVFAGSLMVYFNPKVLTFDLGFQLSFAATLGLVYVSPILQRWFTPAENDKFLMGIAGSAAKKETPKFILSLKEILVATLSAQIAVLPLLIINFGQLSLIAPLANLLILLFIPVTMFWGFLAGLLGIFWLALGKIFGWLAWLFLTYEIKIIEWLAKIPLAAIQFKWNWLGGGVYYFILIWLVWYLTKKYHAKTTLAIRTVS